MEYCPIMKCSAIQDIAIVPVRISQTASSVRDESIRGITEKSRQFVCAFDTGATTSMISSRVAKELAFKMMDTKLVAVCPTGVQRENTCKFNVLFPNNLLLINQYAMITNSAIDVLIGMDIIKNFDFSIFVREEYYYVSLAPRNHLDITHTSHSLDLQQRIVSE